MTQGIKAWHKDHEAQFAALLGEPESKSDKPAPVDFFGTVTPSDVVSYQANGLDKRTRDKLVKGKMAIEGRIDLHGKTQHQAQIELTNFISASYQANKRCLLVVTGKGSREIEDTGLVSERNQRGILRARLTEWIYSAPLHMMVLSHAEATPRDGGSGAFYLYLRNRNKN